MQKKKAFQILITSTYIIALQALEPYITSPIATSIFPPSIAGNHEDQSIQDVSCNVDQLEQANDSQLHSILQDLRQTAFFRMFAVDLDEKCPISFDQKKKVNNQDDSGKDRDNENDDETEQCESEGLPDLDEDSGPACGVKSDDPFIAMFSATVSQSTSSSRTSLMSSMTSDVNSELLSQESDNDHEEFECEGNSEELDEDAPPLCTIDTSSDDENSPFLQLSSSLTTISELTSWESESQKQTFAWSKPSDPVVLETTGLENNPDCQDGNAENIVLSDTFWMDMCSQISSKTTKFINLVLNPKRNTGYNGTHIWQAIYEENCLNLDGSLSVPQCFEERVLYRLLSGLQTSTALSIAKNYYPPSKRKNRTDWEPNPAYFWEKFSSKKDHIDNLYFSYVVLLRALKKIHPFLYSYKINTGNIVEDETAAILLRRLLDTHILRSCNTVFDAFDESLMFQESSVQVFSDNVFDLDHGAISLKQNFKEVFHNISSILDCVQCQQCKLHGKMAMLGYGTALKVLFLPDQLINENSITRNEVVAFINTIAQMSDATKEIRELTHLHWIEADSTSNPPFSSESDQKLINLSYTNNPPFSSEPEKKLIDLVDIAVRAISNLARSNQINNMQESELISKAFARDPYLLILAKHYGFDHQKFLHHLPNISSSYSSNLTEQNEVLPPGAIIIGSGLAGLAAVTLILVHQCSLFL